jgi:hypothetical protein
MLVKLAAVLAALLFAGVSQAAAQPADLSKALVGTWKGEVQMSSGTYPRTLIIKSVQQQGRQRFVEAEYGGPGGYTPGAGGKLEPVDVAVELLGNEVLLRFRAEDLSPVELTLYRDGRHLIGTVLAPSISRGGGRSPAPIKLEKTE